MNSLREFCSKLEMPKEVTEKILALYKELKETQNWEEIEEVMTQLFHEETWETGVKELRETLGEDSQGLKMLTCMLDCGLKTYLLYQKWGISDEIFIDSLKCFSRFVREHHESFGIYGFDREWWTVRQLSGKLFRIGELEYEFKENRKNGKEQRYISLHIPSDANLELEAVHRSYRLAGIFVRQYFPAYIHAKIRCSSWLLAPALRDVLPSNSKIIRFQKEFVIQHVEEESDSFMQWVYKRTDIPQEALPEETTLQRNLKQYILAGRKVGEGAGYLSEKIFQRLFTAE